MLIKKRKTKSEVIFGETDIKATCLTIAIDGFKHDEILNPVAEVYENNLESLDASWQGVSTFSDTLASEISNSSLSVSPVRSTPQSSATPLSHIQRYGCSSINCLQYDYLIKAIILIKIEKYTFHIV